MSSIGAGLEIFARVVAIADEIRAAKKAEGAEAERLFEEAVVRNKKSYADMVADLGGKPEPPPPVVPTPPPPPSTTNFRYDSWVTDPGDGALKNGDYVYEHDPRDGKVYVHEGGPVNFGGFGIGDILRIVRK